MLCLPLILSSGLSLGYSAKPSPCRAGQAPTLFFQTTFSRRTPADTVCLFYILLDSSPQFHATWACFPTPRRTAALVDWQAGAPSGGTGPSCFSSLIIKGCRPLNPNHWISSVRKLHRLVKARGFHPTRAVQLSEASIPLALFINPRVTCLPAVSLLGRKVSSTDNPDVRIPLTTVLGC